MIIDKKVAIQLKARVLENITGGNHWAVYDVDNPITSEYDVIFFNDSWKAEAEAREYQQILNWHISVPSSDLLFELNEIITAKTQHSTGEYTLSKLDTMNLNNLADIKNEAKMLGLSNKIISELEENMKKGISYITPQDRIKGDRDDYIVTAHVKQSSQSDYYYLNRFDMVKSTFPPLEEGKKYLVISGEKDDKGKFPVVTFEKLDEAIENFKKRETSAELAVGTDAAHKTKLAGMEEGKVNYVAPDFKRTLFNPPLPQTFWLQHGKGFTVEQAANMLDGRAVYRDDMLSTNGVPYKAWVTFDTEKPRDRNNNLVTRQFKDPNYGFDLSQSLAEFKIKELENPEKAEKIENSIRNGNRPVVTVEKDGKQEKVFVTAQVRYGKINFYSLDGKTEKREQFLKEPALEGNVLDRKQQQGKEQGVGL